jgi:hypothetical protein
MAKEQYKIIDKFDRLHGALAELPDVSKVKPSTVVAHTALIGATQTFIIQTFRQREQGDTIFLQYLDGEGSVRIAIPPAVADAIARQRETLTTKSRKRAAKERAEADKAQGKVPGFMRNRAPTAENEVESN